MTIDELIEAWKANNALNLEMLGIITNDDLELKPGKGKTIRSNFVHLIGVRRMWSEEKLASEAASIPKLDWKTATLEEIQVGLRLSSEVMEHLFRKREDSAKTGKASNLMFFACAIAHEAHHRSQIEIALRIANREPDDAFLYGLWEWSKKA